MPDERATWLEVMLDRAIASYEAHRAALQLVSTELCRTSQEDDSVQLSSKDRKRLLQHIDTVLHHHALRFSPMTDAPSRSSTPSSKPARRIAAPEKELAASEISSIHSAPPTEAALTPPARPRPRREHNPAAVYPGDRSQDGETSTRRSRSKSGVPLSTWPLPDNEAGSRRGSPTLAEQYRRRRSPSSSRNVSQIPDESRAMWNPTAATSPPAEPHHADPAAQPKGRYERRPRPKPESSTASERPPPLDCDSLSDTTKPQQGCVMEESRKGAQRSSKPDLEVRHQRWDGNPREAAAPRPLRTATSRRGASKLTESAEVEQALFTGGLKAQHQRPDVVRDSPEAERYMAREDAALQQLREEEKQRLRDMAPRDPEGPRRRERDTAIANQLRREQGVLESQLQRMELERDFLLRRNTSDNGSEPRYAQLNHRIGKVTEDLKRVDLELETIQRIEKRASH